MFPPGVKKFDYAEIHRNLLVPESIVVLESVVNRLNAEVLSEHKYPLLQIDVVQQQCVDDRGLLRVWRVELTMIRYDDPRYRTEKLYEEYARKFEDEANRLLGVRVFIRDMK